MPQRRIVLFALFIVQGFCCFYFLADIGADLVFPNAADPTGGFLAFVDGDLFEAIVVLALCLGFAFTGAELRKLSTRNAQLDDQLKVASGAFDQLLQERFEGWGLTKAERDVAVLAIKGFSLAEMAQIRNTKQGTIKAQCAALYRKAGVGGRVELLSLFVDELMGETLIQPQAK